MAKIPDRFTSNTLKGRFKPPRWIAFGEENGVPFRRSYRSLTAAKKLSNKSGISHVTIVPAH